MIKKNTISYLNICELHLSHQGSFQVIQIIAVPVRPLGSLGLVGVRCGPLGTVLVFVVVVIIVVVFFVSFCVHCLCGCCSCCCWGPFWSVVISKKNLPQHTHVSLQGRLTFRVHHKSVNPKFTHFQSKIECTRTDNIFPSLSEVRTVAVTLVTPLAGWECSRYVQL